VVAAQQQQQLGLVRQASGPPPLRRDVERLAKESFDLTVIGGGISGVAIAYEAAARGLRTALVERHDYACGTTTASTKLIHGGVRYLESFEFSLVREALRERRILLNVAPHLINTLPFLLPVYHDSAAGRLKLTAGMFVYDLLSYDKNWKVRNDKHMPWRKSLSKASVLEMEPALDPDGLQGAALYYDAQVPSPARLTIEFAKSAVRHGAALANYAEVEGLAIDNGALSAVKVHDLRSGEHIQIKTRVAVNAAGLWATRVMGMLAEQPKVHLAPSKGIHLITRPLLKEHAAVFLTRAGRRLMIIPWLGKSLIGTTDVFYKGNIERIRCTHDEIVEMVREVNEVLPSAKLHIEEVERAYAGCRPLIAKAGVSSLDLSRHWEIVDHAHEHARGIYSVVGGKLTTSRSVAKHVIDRVQKHIGHKSGSPTRQLPIGGGDIGPLEAEIAQLSKDFGLDEDVAKALMHSYGSGARPMLEAAKSEPRALERIQPGRPYLRAEVRHAVEQESAFAVTDVALRRTDLGNLGDAGGEGGRVIADEMQRLLGWNDAERDRQLAAYLDELKID
jgi:glycerol-3-phosphate dehydrogenase